MNHKTESWREDLELSEADMPKFPGLRSSAEILAGMMRAGKLDALDEKGDDAETKNIREA